jgi:two-component system KDP operon response regulator KdpE
MSRILIVDDEPQILRMLRASLVSSGYEVVSAGNGLEAFETFERTHPDLIITDMSMPVMDGFALTQEIRRVSQVPVIILSVRDAEPVKVNSLDAGADDYVTKPFNMPELLARVRAHLRRDVAAAAPASVDVQAGDFAVEAATRTVSVRGTSIHLTPKEYDLLLAFLQSPDRLVTHRSLVRAVWGAHADVQPENLRVLVAQLRRKIETDGIHYIHSEPWVGYTLRTRGEQTAL